MVHDDTTKSIDEVASVFEEYYQNKKRNFAILADVFKKGILNEGKKAEFSCKYFKLIFCV